MAVKHLGVYVIGLLKGDGSFTSFTAPPKKVLTQKLTSYRERNSGVGWTKT